MTVIKQESEQFSSQGSLLTRGYIYVRKPASTRNKYVSECSMHPSICTVNIFVLRVIMISDPSRMLKWPESQILFNHCMGTVEMYHVSSKLGIRWISCKNL